MEVVRQRRGGGEWAAHCCPQGCPTSARCTDAGPQRSQDSNPPLGGLSHKFSSLTTVTGRRKSVFRRPCQKVPSGGSPLQETPPPPQGRKPWSLFQKPNLHASTSRARPVECLRGDERHQEGPCDFPATPHAFPHTAGTRQMLRMGVLSLTHQSPRGLWDAGPSVMDKGRGELGGWTDGHEQTRPPPPSPSLP